MSIRDCSNLNVNISVIVLREFKFFFLIFPGKPGILTRSIVYSKTVIGHVINPHNKISSLILIS